MQACFNLFSVYHADVIFDTPAMKYDVPLRNLDTFCVYRRLGVDMVTLRSQLRFAIDIFGVSTDWITLQIYDTVNDTGLVNRILLNCHSENHALLGRSARIRVGVHQSGILILLDPCSPTVLQS